MKNIVCLGDSITAGASCFEGRRWTAVLQGFLDADFPDRFAVYNRGIGGNTSGQGIDRFALDVKAVAPDFVLIEFGFNDASVPSDRGIHRVSPIAFRENLTELVRLTRACKARPILVVNHPIIRKTASDQGNKKSYYSNFAPYQGFIREVSQKTRAPAIDLEKLMRGIPQRKFLSEDGLHLTIEGNRIYAEFLYKGLKPLLGGKRGGH